MLLTAFLPLMLVREPGIDPKKLTDLVQQCKETESECLVVMIDGKIVIDKWFRGEKGPIEAMSATKSVVNLAIGMLIKDGKIWGVGDRVQRFFPNYKGGGKENVTIRNLLEHTSGIQANPTTEDIYSSQDFVANALEKPLTSPPGTTFFYNNRALNLLAGVASKAAGQKLDVYLDRKLFKRLGITNYAWIPDQAGNPQGMAGFHVQPEDFAKIGEFVRKGAGGLLPDRWIEDSIKPTALSIRAGEPCGRLWWPILEQQGVGINDGLVEAWKKAKIPQRLIDKVLPIKDKVFATPPDLFASVRGCFKDDGDGLKEFNVFFTSARANAWADLSGGPVHSYAAEGYLGQYLVIVPSAHLVAVRMRRARNETEDESQERSFGEFPEVVDNLNRLDKKDPVMSLSAYARSLR